VVADAWPLKTSFARKVAKRTQAADKEETRAGFWRQRARRFQVDGRFPALVTGQLLPGWHDVCPDEDDEYDTKQHESNTAIFGFSQTLLKSTESIDAKFQKKQQEEEKYGRQPWMAIGTAGASDCICGRGPVLHLGDTFREPVKCREFDPRLVLKEPLLPVGRASMMQRSSYADLAGAGCSPANSESRQREILERKLRGEACRKELERRYASRRQIFRDRRDKMANTTISGWRTVGSLRPPRQTSFTPQLSNKPPGQTGAHLLKDLSLNLNPDPLAE